MEEIVKEKLIKALSQKVECDAKGFVKVKSLNEIISVVDETVVKHYKDQLRNLAQISKNFIYNASQIYHGDTIESHCLKEELQALEYAIKLAEEKYND